MHESEDKMLIKFNIINNYFAEPQINYVFTRKAFAVGSF